MSEQSFRLGLHVIPCYPLIEEVTLRAHFLISLVAHCKNPPKTNFCYPLNSEQIRSNIVVLDGEQYKLSRPPLGVDF